MLTQVKTPREIFYQPQRLMVPLFQRPYVWSKEGQWAPLWEDVERLALRRLNSEECSPHFLGAVVLQHQALTIGALPVRTIIDGQQRLTTLQLLLNACFEQISLAGFGGLARQLEDLVTNPEHFTSTSEDRFKVWPTNRDRVAFNEVMGSPSATNPASHKFPNSRLIKAHDYFSSRAEEWFQGDRPELRAHALVETLSSLLQLVVIELQADEDAQEIFETLNARGTPLTPADLIKNFVFQRLSASQAEAENVYQLYWAAFETPFWESEVSAGRVSYSRSSLFLNQWLVAQSLRDVAAREVFSQFKRHVTDQKEPIHALLPKIHDAAAQYREMLENSANPTQILSRSELFLYRTGTLESEVVKPLVLWLHDLSRSPIDRKQLDMVLETVESWLVRRACVRASTKAYNRIFVELLNHLARAPREGAGDATVAFFRGRTSPNDYWPGDAEVRRELTSMPVYKRFRRSRLRMILEAIEDYRRGWTGRNPLHEQPMIRGIATIEHLMPQEWRTNWSVESEDEVSQSVRDANVQTLGNLTLLTQALNSRVSNGPWLGVKGKLEELQGHTSLLLTRDVARRGIDGWTEGQIAMRTSEMIDEILKIWPVPEGHTGAMAASLERATPRVEVADLIAAGLLSPGHELFARVRAHRGRRARVAQDGSLFVDSTKYETLSAAAKGVTGAQSEAGWWFWLVDERTEVSMSDIRQQYLEDLATGGEHAASE